MSNYEFWDELGKIFNAVVAYQEKSIEFNKRFINPWIRVGNVFDKQDRNKEAVNAYKKAIEIDPNNAQNWYELGNIYFRMENFDEAVEAFNKAIELEPGFGWSYCNLGLTLVSQGNYAKAIPLYSRSIDLLEENKDKAMAWNRLGNVYRKLNEYSLAVEAFQKADELDKENAGFRDDLDEVSEGPSLVEGDSETGTEQARMLAINPIEFMAGSQAEEASDAATEASSESETSEPEAEVDAAPQVVQVTADSQPGAEAVAEEPEADEDVQPETGPEVENAAVVDEPQIGEVPEIEASTPASNEVAPAEKTSEESAEAAEPVAVEAEMSENAAQTEEQSVTEAVAEPEPEAEIQTEKPAEVEQLAMQEMISQTIVTSDEADQSTGEPVSEEQTVTTVLQETVETYTETIEVNDAAPEATAVVETPEEIPASTDVATRPAAQAEEAVPVEEINAEEESVEQAAEVEEPAVAEVPAEDALTARTEDEPEAEVDVPSLEVQAEAEGPAAEEVEPSEDETIEETPDSVHAAYEEFLKDNGEQLNITAMEASQESQTEEPADPPEPVAKIDESGDVQIEMDAKNAHVWNELGNVYYNTGAFDDAVVAYSKAIDLDRWFAWPYSNLALAYVQKGRFAEAILLYQRSIELFKSEKDKAISWNRLGNVYRRLNDYDNAIAAYQRADELDPDNTTLSLQSRFSLLGSFATERKPSYVS